MIPEDRYGSETRCFALHSPKSNGVKVDLNYVLPEENTRTGAVLSYQTYEDIFREKISKSKFFIYFWSVMN